MAEKKFYWLKLKKDFFKRHDIRIIEDMPNGKDYILFYLKMLLESIDHEGELRFSETIPYNEQMLSVITNTNIDIVKSAMNIFIELNMVEIFDDSTIYMAEVQKLTGCETEYARKKREYRQKLLEAKQSEDNVETKKDNVRQEKEIEKEIEIEKDNNNTMSDKPTRKCFVPPTIEEVETYCRERQNVIDAEGFIDFYTSKGWFVGKNKMKDWKAAVRTWERSRKSGNKSQPTNNNQPQKEFNFRVDGIAESGEEYMVVDGKWFNRWGKELNSKGYEIIDFGLRG